MGAANVKGEARTLHETAACKSQYKKEEGPFWNSGTDALVSDTSALPRPEIPRGRSQLPPLPTAPASSPT